MTAKTFDFGEKYVITHTDDVCWTVATKRAGAALGKKGKGGRYNPISYHGTLAHALRALLCLLADDDPQAATVGDYIGRIESVWADVRRVVRAGLKGGA